MHPSGAQSTHSQQAFTLAEVMMAAVVLLIAIVGLFEAVTVGAGMLNVARKQTIALQIIRTEIEAVHLSTTWTQTTPADATVGPVAIDTLTSSSLLGYPELMSLKNNGKGFALSRTIFTVRNTSNWLKKVTFTVTWTESTGRTYSRTGYTYCAKNGFNALYQR
jgi:hypothetical protein